MKIEDIDLACQLKYQLDELQAVMNFINHEDNAEKAIHISVYSNGERRHVPRATGEKIINIIQSDIEAIKRDIEAL